MIASFFVRLFPVPGLGRRFGIALAAFAGLAAAPGHAETERYSVVSNGEIVGFVEAVDDAGAAGAAPGAEALHRVVIRYDVKNNGRGPTMREELTLDAGGLPLRWTLDGQATFGSAVRERFERGGAQARWTDSTGAHRGPAPAGAVYVAQNASPWALGVYARALLRAPDGRLPTIPGGTLRIESLGSATVEGTEYRAFAISGIDLAPDMILLDAQGALFAHLYSGGATMREGHESTAPALSALATRLTAQRYAGMQQQFAHRIDAPVRVRNVRVFDSATGILGDPVSVLFYRGVITGIQPLDAPATPGEAVVEGAGGTLLPGLHDMHAHVDLQSALLYIAAGVTSVRDMGNDNDFLRTLMAEIDDGTVAGPRITANGFLEGRSPFSARNGIVADSEDAAIDAVRWYAARGYWQVKIYNSMNPEWVPAIARTAHALGMGVTGHIPAFTNADAMIAAGYDEITHINQLMLGWVLNPEEDTRTPLRLTAMRRTAGMDLSAPRVQATLDLMQRRNIALDPTAVTLELLMLSRDGVPGPSVAAYIDHMPIGVQRNRRQAIAPIAGPADDAAYRGAFDTIKALLRMVHARGIRLLPGTDDGTGLSLHRELQIYGEAGIAPADVLRMATSGAEEYLGRGQQIGRIERGMRADFLLLPGNPVEDLNALHRIAMVVKDGVLYFPSEIYPAFGIRPFAEAPAMTLPDASQTPEGRGEPRAAQAGGHAHGDAFLF